MTDQGRSSGAGNPVGASSSNSYSHSSDSGANETMAEEPKQFRVNEHSLRSSAATNGKVSQPVRATTLLNKQLDDIIDLEIEDINEKTRWRLVKILWNYIWPDYMLDHLDWESCKPVIRTWLVWWLMIVFMVINPIGDYLGTASFLLLVVAFIEHSGGFSIMSGFLITFLDVAYCFLGFMFIVIGNAIAWRIRGYPTRRDCIVELVEKGLCPQSPLPETTACALKYINDGYFLTTKTTVVNVFAMAFALVICGYPPTQQRLFILPWIFAAITIVATGVILNNVPWFEPWLLGKLIIVPMAIALAAKFFFCVTVFPTSSNRKFFTGLVKVSRTAMGIYSGFAVEQTTKMPSSAEFEDKVRQFVDSANQALISFALLELDGFVSRIEVCYSRLDPGNLGEFRAMMRQLVASLSGFQFFHEGIAEKRDAIRETLSRQEQSSGSKMPRPTYGRTDSFSAKPPPRKHCPHWLEKKLQRTYLASANYETRHQDINASFNWDTDRTQVMSLDGLDNLYTAIVDHYRDVTDATLACLSVCCDWMAEANKARTLTLLIPSYRRTRRRKQIELAQEVAKAADSLNKALLGVRDAKEWIKRTFHNDNPVFLRHHYAYSLSQDAFYGYVAHQCAAKVTQIAKYCMEMDKIRPRPEFITPLTKSHSKRPRFESEYVGCEALDLGAAGDQTHHEDYLPIKSVERRDPDSSPPRTGFHLFGRGLQKIWSVFTSRTFYFLLKRTCVTLACCSLYFFRTTAGFAYRHRILWVAIMVLFTIAQQAVDGVYGFVTKLWGTFLGSLIGMVVWYISTGNGRGNAYGLCAALGVAMIPVAFHRHYNKQRIPAFTTVMASTIGLVAGTSWSDIHFPSTVELGYGFRVAWIRFVEVAAALIIAFIFTVLPHVTTAKTTVRMTIGRCLERIGDLQSSISNFGLQRYKDSQVHIRPRDDIIIQKRSAIFSNLGAAKGAAKLIDFEPPLGGVWPKHRYKMLLQLEAELALLYGDLHTLIDNVEDTSRLPEIMKCMGWTSSDITSSVFSVLYMTCRALVAAEPLPAITPAHLSEMYTKLLEELLNFNDRESYERAIEESYNDHDGRMLLAAVTMSSYVYEHVDGIMVLVKSLVGEMFDSDPRVYYDFDAESQDIPFLGLGDYKAKYN